MPTLFSLPWIRSILKQTPLYPILLGWRNRRAVALWKRQGCPAPPPQAVKYQVIRDHAAQAGIGLFIETGTYLGDSIYANRNIFRSIYSIELSEDLHRQACRRFARLPHVTILHGDSASVLPRLLGDVQEPALFWLDGHYSGGVTARGSIDTPIVAELEAILAHPIPNHVILIDDARCFDGTGGYPSIPQIKDLILSRRPTARIEAKDDIIRVYLDSRPAVPRAV